MQNVRAERAARRAAHDNHHDEPQPRAPELRTHHAGHRLDGPPRALARRLPHDHRLRWLQCPRQVQVPLRHGRPGRPRKVPRVQEAAAPRAGHPAVNGSRANLWRSTSPASPASPASAGTAAWAAAAVRAWPRAIEHRPECRGLDMRSLQQLQLAATARVQTVPHSARRAHSGEGGRALRAARAPLAQRLWPRRARGARARHHAAGLRGAA